MKRLFPLLFHILIFSPSLAQSALQMSNYPPSVTTVTVESSNLPLVWITTTDTLSRYTRCLGHMKVINNPDGVNYGDTVAHPDQTVEFDGPIAVKWRGASSFGRDGSRSKKPFSVKTLKMEDINGKKDKVKLLGLGKDNDWCFLAPWQDNSYIRDVLTMQMARGGHVFAPQMRYCEVFMDGIYYGVYILSERATGGSKRLNLWDYGKDGDGNPTDDTSGDFHVEIDHPFNTFSLAKDPHYVSKYHPVRLDGTEIEDRYVHYQYKDPDEEDFGNLPGAREAVHKAIDDMEDAFAADNYGELYADHIDVLSFMDYEIGQEVANNIDAYRQSTPMWKYSTTHAAVLGDNDRWKMALWDFNLAYVNVASTNTNMMPNRPEWRYTANGILYNDYLQKELLNPFYWQRLMEDSAYVRGIRARYTERRKTGYSEARIDAIVDSLYQILCQGAVTRNNKAWKKNPNLESQIASVRNFAVNRLTWMDERWYVKDSVGMTIYFDNSATGWEHVYAYSWLNDSTREAEWPGVELTVKDYETATGGYYRADVRYSNVIFSDGTDTDKTPAFVAMDGHIYGGGLPLGSTGRGEYVPVGNSLFFPSYAGVAGDNVVILADGEYRCRRLVLTDGCPYDNPASFLAEEVVYVREPGTGRWGTVCLPFDVPEVSGVRFYSLRSVEDGVMTFSGADGLEANVPGVFKLADNAESLNIVLADADIRGNDGLLPSTTLVGWTMRGTYAPLEDLVSSDGTRVYFIAQDHFWEAQSPISVAPFRGWFETAGNPSQARFRIEESDGLEAIESVTASERTAREVFDLSGRVTSRKTKGLSVVNGSIVLSK